MSNRFRAKSTEQEEEVYEPVEQEVEESKKKSVGANNFFLTLFREGVVSKEAASDMVPFVVFLVFLGMLYIANRHFAENNIRQIDKLSKEVKELGWDFKTLKANLMLKSTQTEVAKRVDTMGLKEPVAPPKKIMVDKSELDL